MNRKGRLVPRWSVAGAMASAWRVLCALVIHAPDDDQTGIPHSQDVVHGRSKDEEERREDKGLEGRRPGNERPRDFSLRSLNARTCFWRLLIQRYTEKRSYRNLLGSPFLKLRGRSLFIWRYFFQYTYRSLKQIEEMEIKWLLKPLNLFHSK